VGAFSSGGLGGNLDQNFPKYDGATTNKALKELWVSCGTEDGLITFNRNLVKWLKGKNTTVDFHETPGRHAWMVWRRNLIEFSALLFR
jgi:enterochelin esterase family protein